MATIVLLGTYNSSKRMMFKAPLWGEEYYQNLQTLSSNLNPNDYEYLNNLFKTTEISKIL